MTLEPITVYNKTVTSEVVAGIIAKIKEKKELVNVEDDFCRGHIKQFFTENPAMMKKLVNVKDYSKVAKSKEVAEVVKWVRRKTRGVYGLFQSKDVSRIGALLDKLEKALETKHLSATLDIHKELLSVHVSSQERLEIYPQFYAEIFAITGRPKSILEIASGFNPFSLPYMDLNDLTYTATDLNADDMALVKRYFDIVKPHFFLKGDAYAVDLTKDYETVTKIEADVCFAFKLFDLLDNKLSENIIIGLKTDWVIASFPTKTVTNIDMRVKRRSGFQKMLRRVGLVYKTVEFENELVYIIDKRGDGDEDE